VSFDSTRSRPRRRSTGERVFADEIERLWSAALTRSSGGWAVVFACITDARQPVRALALPDDDGRAEFTEAILRTWLARAPRIGALN
jgi:hypothetical protein